MRIHSGSVLAAVLLGGFIAGTIDIGAAALINTVSPYTIMQAIAGGVLGKDSFHQGMPAAVTGPFAAVGNVAINCVDFRVRHTVGAGSEALVAASGAGLWHSRDFSS